MQNIHPYEMISEDKTRKQENDRFRIIIYGAYNACGLIGPEMNGIAILDNKKKSIICDGIERIDFGGLGASNVQMETFADIMNMGLVEFVNYVNEVAPNLRYRI